MSQDTATYTFRRTKLASAIHASLPLLAAGTLAVESQAYAQDSAGQQAIEEVIVTGVRQSLESAQALKRNAAEIVDSITAQDIGALPDRSVTETLQRIPGVSIDRFAAGRDPDHFSVEGSGVIVRGLTYVRSEVNSREAFTANNGRGLSFADVPPELLIGVDVFKSPSADRIEGGIAGTVNLRTRRPFDSPESMFAFSLESQYSDFIEENSPLGSVLGSYRWDTDAGEFGILASGVYSQVQSRADRFQISNFAERTLYSSGDVIDTGGGETPVDTVYFPRGAVAGTQSFDREREGISAAFQWRSPDDAMEATFQFLNSESREAWTEHVIEIATDNVTNNGDSRAVPGTTLDFYDSNLFESGHITGPSGWRSDQNGPDPRTPINALQSNNIRRDVKQKYVTDDYSFNFLWNLNDNWAVNFDYQHVDSTVENLDVGLWVSTWQNAQIALNGDELPTVAFTAPELCTGTPGANCPTYFTGTHDSYTDPYNSFYRSAMDHIEDSEGNLDSVRVDFERVFSESSWVDSVRFGYRWAERDNTARFSTYNWGSLSEIWGGTGPVWLDDPVASNGGQPLMGYAPFYFDNFMNGDTQNPVAGGRLFYGQNTVDDYQAFADYASAIAGEWDGGASWVPLANRGGVVDGTWFLPGEINPVLEENNAAYFMLRFDNPMDNGWNLSGNIGLRYTETTRDASGYEVFQDNAGNFPTEDDCANVPPGQNPPAFCTLDPQTRADARIYADGSSIPIVANLKYDYWLPSLNLKLEVAEGVQFRAAYFKGVAPPDFGLTRAYFVIPLSANQEDLDAGNGEPISRVNSGNPYLLPVESDNYDLTFEWYFADVGQLSFALFYKELTNIRTNSVERVPFTNNGVTFDAIVTTAINSPETGKIKGFEVAYQQTYDMLGGWLGGFGLQANYTFIDSSNVPQSTLSETDPDVASGRQSTVDISLLPLEGLSEHTVNITPFYDWGGWSARLAYSWRSEFLLTVRDVIVPFQPIMNEATGQLDGSVFYTINDNWKVGLQGVNLTNEVIKTSAIVNDDLFQAPRSWFMNDRRFSIIVRGTFGSGQ